MERICFFVDSQTLGGPYCGTSLKGKTLVTYGNSLRLEFKTDESFALCGFQANIDFVPRKGGEIIDVSLYLCYKFQSLFKCQVFLVFF